LITATSWLVASLVGLGVVPAFALYRGGAWARPVGADDWTQSITLSLMLGILVDLFVGLLSGSLRMQMWFCWAGYLVLSVLVVFAARRAARGLSRPENILEMLRGSWQFPRLTGYIWVVVTLVVVSLAIASTPIFDWDARSIWFFHGKAIFFDGGLHPSDFWRNDEYGWSHKPYPPLIPMLAARAADHTLGSWNEFAPKLGLIPLACAGFFGLLVVTRSSLEFVLLTFSAIAVLGPQLWNGYGDGWLALAGCTAIYALARWVESGERSHLLFGCAALAIALFLKNEGQLLFAVAIPIFLYGARRQGRHLRWGDAAIALVFAPFVLWIVRRPQLPAVGDIEGSALIARAFDVITNWPEMTHRLFVLAQTASKGTFLLESFAAFVVFGVLTGVDRISVLLGSAALLYTMGVVITYFGIPADFGWFVRFSLDRVLMLPTLLLLAGLVRMIHRSLQGQTAHA